jgi:general L-amino acid transport system permease protein
MTGTQAWLRAIAWASTERGKRILIQAALATAVAAVIVLMVWNVALNLERQSLRLGFDFLNRPAGFSVLQTLIPFNETSSYGRAFVVGLLNTLLVAALGIVASTLLGFTVGFARLAPNRIVRAAAAVYVEVFRNLPLLLVLFFLYFGLLRQLPAPRQSFELFGAYLNNRGLFVPFPEMTALHVVLLFATAITAIVALFWRQQRRWFAIAALAAVLAFVLLPGLSVTWPQPRGLSITGGARLIPEFVGLVLALTVYSAAYIAEIVRAGIEGVARGQGEAAEALGFSPWQRARLIILPQALRLIVPPLTSQFLNLTKNSSLAVAIAYPDLVSVFAGTALAQTGQAVEIIGITMLVYLSLSLLTAAVINVRSPRWR